MAELEIDRVGLVLHLRGLEKAEGAHSDIRVPLSSVTAVRAVDFAAVHGKGQAVVIELERADDQRLIVTLDDAMARARTIAEAVGKG